MKMKNALFTATLLCAAFWCEAQQTLVSPDGNLSLVFELDEAGTPTYALNYKQQIGRAHV